MVAICVVLVPALAVGAVGTPVNAGLANIVSLDSLVTLPSPTCAAVTPLTVPVNVGLLNIVALDSLVTLPRPSAVVLGNTRLSSVASPAPVIVAPTVEPCVTEPTLNARLTKPASTLVPLSSSTNRLPPAETAMLDIPTPFLPSAPNVPGVPGGPAGPAGPVINTTLCPSSTVLTAVVPESTTVTKGCATIGI